VSLNQDFQLVEAVASVDSAGCVSLGNRAHLPEQEQWLWRNPAALESVKLGIEQAKAGQVKDLGNSIYSKDN
jgi:hypothetical protein